MVTIAYDFTKETTTNDQEQVPGQLVYFSTDGTPGSWTSIPAISGAATPGPKVADAIVGSWIPGSLLYILWADDNGTISPDHAFEIDNFSISPSTNRLPVMTVTLSTNNVSEGAGRNAAHIDVNMDGPLSAALTIRVNVSDPSKIDPPAEVTLLAGSSNTSFQLDTVNYPDIDGTKVVTLTVSAVGYSNVIKTLTVGDDDTPSYYTLGGNLSGTISNGSYNVLSTITVAQNRSLTIEPGSVLRFNSNCGLFVYGSLTASNSTRGGTKFLSAMPNPTKGSWLGISITNATGSQVVLDGIEVSHGVNGVHLGQKIPQATLFLRNSDLHDCASEGVALRADRIAFPGLASNLVQVNCKSYQNGRYGIYLNNNAYPCGGTHNAAAVIGNEVYGNVTAGIAAKVAFLTGCDGNNLSDIFRGFIDSAVWNNRVYGNGIGIYGYSESGGER